MGLAVCTARLAARTRARRNLFAGRASGDDTTRLYGNGCAGAMRGSAGRDSTGDRIDGGWSKTIGGMLGT